MSASAQIPACLATTVCPNCSYSLSGLGDTGICPECARQFDQSQVILYGWGRGQHESVATAKKSRMGWVIFLSMLWVVFQFNVFLFNPHGTKYILITVGALAAITAYSIFRRSDTTHPGQVQIRLSDSGAVQYDNLQGPGELERLLVTQGYWIPFIGAAALLVCYRTGSIGPLSFWIWFVAAVVIGVCAMIAARKARRELAGMPDNAIADANAAYIKPTPWEKLSRDFLLRPSKGGNYRLRMEIVTKWLTRYPIDAEIQCTAQQAAELDKYIRSKMEAVRPPDPRLLEAIEQWKRYQEKKAH